MPELSGSGLPSVNQLAVALLRQVPKAAARRHDAAMPVGSVEYRTTASGLVPRSNSAVLTDVFSSLRFAYGAANRGR